MQTPVVGQQVKFFGHTDAPAFAAFIAFVHSETSVNLMVIDMGGNPFPAYEVILWQEGDKPAARWCEF
jgi:hypothetical protein